MTTGQLQVGCAILMAPTDSGLFMADVRTPTSAEDRAPPILPSSAETPCNEAVLDVLEMILLGASLSEVLALKAT